MKIICTVEEFASIIRECHTISVHQNCEHCAMNGICESGFPEEVIEFMVREDIHD